MTKVAKNIKLYRFYQQPFWVLSYQSSSKFPSLTPEIKWNFFITLCFCVCWVFLCMFLGTLSITGGGGRTSDISKTR